jgi:hypothetical protein
MVSPELPLFLLPAELTLVAYGVPGAKLERMDRPVQPSGMEYTAAALGIF